MRLLDHVEPARLVTDRATLGDVEDTLATGRPAYVLLGDTWRALLPRAAVGHAASRRLIDLPLVRVPIWPVATGVDVLLDRDALGDWCLVGEPDRVLGQVSRRKLVAEATSLALGDGAGPLVAALTARATASFVHDLANALTGVELSLHTGLPTNADLRAAQAALKHANALARQLRALCMRQEPAPPPTIKLEPIVEGLLALLEAMTPRDIRIVLALSDAPPVRAHAWMLERVLLNLCVNAAEALDGVGRIEIATGACEHEGVVYGLLQVTDDGPGIPPALADTIFEPGVTHRPGVGAGLGLSIVARTAASLGGMAHVEPGSHGGARFRVLLPAAGTAG